MKKILLLAFAFMIVGCNDSEPSSAIEDSSQKITKNQSQQIRSEVLETETYDAKILYAPIRYPHPELIKRLKAMVDAEKQLFFDSPGLDEVANDPELRKWMLQISTKPIYESETFSSYLIQVYIDSGGAHGNTHYAVLNFDHQYGDTIEFTEVFDTRDVLSVVSEQSIAALKKKFEDSPWIEDGAGPDLGNYHYWNYTPVGMLITFPPYQVAPYAAGSPTVLIEKKHLQPYLSKLGKRMWGE